MKLLLCFPLAAVLLAQTPPPATPPAATPAAPAATPAAPAATPAAPAATPAAPAATPAAPAATPVTPAAAPASPVPSGESWLTGYIDLGYQWAGTGGSYPTYRSVVNLGSGPKLTGADFTILDPKHRYFDRVRVRAYDWGDDPYSSFHLFAVKQGIYEFDVDYRRLSYFNAVPSFANPLLGSPGALDEQSFDTRRTVGSFSLDLLKGHMFSPYLGYDRDSSSGQGVETFVTQSDEFAVPDTLSDSTNLYRGGVHIARSRFHITLEEGGTTFKNDQNTYTATTLAPNPGNSSAVLFGHPIDLSGLLQDYGIRGTSTFSKAIVTANPFSWLDVYGTFLYSEPRDNVNYKQYNNGSFLLESQLLFYTSEQYLAVAAAKMPHTSANIGFEVRPLKRIRLIESWSTDRLHNASSVSQSDTLIGGGVSTPLLSVLQGLLATNYSQAESTVIADVSRSVTVRAGYRYTWGDGNNAVYPNTDLISLDKESIRQQAGLGTATWRMTDKFSLTGEAEIASSGGAYFRTSLYNYRKARALGRYRLTKSLNLSATYNILSNRNPNLAADYKYLVHQESAALAWNPAGKPYSFDGSYEHCVYNSHISYLVPQTLSPAESIYVEDCHTISAYFNDTYKGAKLVAGGSAVITSGSRPTTYYQPTVKLNVPLRKNIGWYAEWRYYGFSEAFYLYEGFRAQLFITGLRFSR